MNKKLLVVAALLSSSMAFAKEAESNEACAISSENVSIAQKNLTIAERAEKVAEAELTRTKEAKEPKEKIRDAAQVLKNAQYDVTRAKAALEKERTIAQHDCQS